MKQYYPFLYYQNGGGYIPPAAYICIIANKAKHADSVAKALGLYFNGVAKNKDHESNGDRWHKAHKPMTVFPDQISLQNTWNLIKTINTDKVDLLLIYDGRTDKLIWINDSATAYHTLKKLKEEFA